MFFLLVHETGFTRPTFFDLLPFKLFRFTVTFWTSLPAKYRAYQEHLEEVKRKKLEEELEKEEEEEEGITTMIFLNCCQSHLDTVILFLSHLVVEQPRPRKRQRVVFPEALPEDEDTAWVGAPVINRIEPEEIATEDSDDTKIKVHHMLRSFVCAAMFGASFLSCVFFVSVSITCM